MMAGYKKSTPEMLNLSEIKMWKASSFVERPYGHNVK